MHGGGAAAGIDTLILFSPLVHYVRTCEHTATVERAYSLSFGHVNFIALLLVSRSFGASTFLPSFSEQERERETRSAYVVLHSLARSLHCWSPPPLPLPLDPREDGRRGRAHFLWLLASE